MRFLFSYFISVWLIMANGGPSQAKAAVERVNTVKSMAIYYGYPSLVNGSNGDVEKAYTNFHPFDLIVFGDGLQNLDHEDHAKTKTIMGRLRNDGNEVFGYIPIGQLSVERLDKREIENRVLRWKDMGASGIFLDEYGFDYQVTRSFQNEIVGIVHKHGLAVFANAWRPMDAMGDRDEKGGMQSSLLGTGDTYLMEDWIVGHGRLQKASEWARKADEAQKLSSQTGVRIASLSTANSPKDAKWKKEKRYIENGVAMYGFYASQWTDPHHSSVNNQLYNVLNQPEIGQYYLSDRVRHDKFYFQMWRPTNKGMLLLKQKHGQVSSDFTENP